MEDGFLQGDLADRGHLLFIVPGMKAGDLIMMLDETNVRGLSLNDAVNAARCRIRPSS